MSATGATTAVGVGAAPFTGGASLALPVLGAGLDFIGGLFSGNAQANQNKQTLLQQYLLAQQARRDQGNALLGQYLQGQQGFKQAQAEGGVQDTQLNPYQHAMDLNAAKVRASFGAGLGPNGLVKGPLDLSALSPTSLQSSADNFFTNVAAANPTVPVSGMASPNVQQFAGQRAGQQQQDGANVMAYLQQFGKTADTGSPADNQDPCWGAKIMGQQQYIDCLQRRQQSGGGNA